METNQNLISSESQIAPETPFNQAQTIQIADALRELFDPAYILLFGKMAGKTPFSETIAYDLMVITDNEPLYNWMEAKRYLKIKLPWIGHGVPYTNIYVYTRHDVEVNYTPFFYLARKEGIVLYRSHDQKFARPKKQVDFGLAAANATKHTQAFLPLADRLLDFADLQVDRRREAAFASAQAAVYYFRTLFYVYHGFEAETSDIRILHQRLRTLSAKLPLLFEPDESRAMRTLHRLNVFLTAARYDPEFCVRPEELTLHIERVKRLAKIVKQMCSERIDFYLAKAK